MDIQQIRAELMEAFRESTLKRLASISELLEGIEESAQGRVHAVDVVLDELHALKGESKIMSCYDLCTASEKSELIFKALKNTPSLDSTRLRMSIETITEILDALLQTSDPSIQTSPDAVPHFSRLDELLRHVS